MLYVANALHVEYQTVIKALKRSQKPYDSATTLKEACKIIDNEDIVTTNKIIFVGFIYKDEEVSDYVKNVEEKYFISNIGYMPEDFITSDREDFNTSLLEQLTKLNLLEKQTCEVKDGSGMIQYYEDEELTKFIKFKPYNPLFQPYKIFNISYVDYHMLEVFTERAYVKGNTFLIYENNPINKLFLAHKLLDTVDKGLVVIGSQTRSTNDMLSFYGKNIDMQVLADKFELDIELEGDNTFNVFIPSHMHVLGNNIIKFISEGN